MAESLNEIRGHAFHDEIVVLDERAFVDCTFSGCELRYHGGPVTFQDIRITGCSWQFGGAAQRSVNMLKLFGLSATDPTPLEDLPLC